MIFLVHNRHRCAHWLPIEFEAMHRRDAQVIMQAWADRLTIGRLEYNWSESGCGVFFWRNGIRERFATLIEKQGD